MNEAPRKPDPKAIREAKLAKALRDNLRRRKTVAARALASKPPGSTDGPEDQED